MLCWVLIEQVRHEYMSDEYKNRYIVIVLWYSSSWVPNILEITTAVPSELVKGDVSQADKY